MTSKRRKDERTIKDKLAKLDLMYKKISVGDTRIAQKRYGEAIHEFETAILLSNSKSMVRSIRSKISHCKMADQGIVYFGGIYYQNGIEILEEEANTLTNIAIVRIKNNELVSGKRKRRKGITIKVAIMEALQNNPKLPLKEATTIAQGIKEGTKFDESHFAYYKSIFKKEYANGK